MRYLGNIRGYPSCQRRMNMTERLFETGLKMKKLERGFFKAPKCCVWNEDTYDLVALSTHQ
jgi:hypothetical protein